MEGGWWCVETRAVAACAFLWHCAGALQSLDANRFHKKEAKWRYFDFMEIRIIHNLWAVMEGIEHSKLAINLIRLGFFILFFFFGTFNSVGEDLHVSNFQYIGLGGETFVEDLERI